MIRCQPTSAGTDIPALHSLVQEYLLVVASSVTPSLSYNAKWRKEQSCTAVIPPVLCCKTCPVLLFGATILDLTSTPHSKRLRILHFHAHVSPPQECDLRIQFDLHQASLMTSLANSPSLLASIGAVMRISTRFSLKYYGYRITCCHILTPFHFLISGFLLSALDLP